MIIKKVCPKYGNTKIVHLSKLELEPPLFVKDLNPVVVGVSHNPAFDCSTYRSYLGHSVR